MIELVIVKYLKEDFFFFIVYIYISILGCVIVAYCAPFT